MPNLDENVEKLLKELQTKRGDLGRVANSSHDMYDDIETRVKAYLGQSKTNMPNMEMLSRILDSLANLYRINADVNDKIIKSIEKETDMRIKREKDAVDEDDKNLLTHDVLLKAAEVLVKEKIVNAQNQEKES